MNLYKLLFIVLCCALHMHCNAQHTSQVLLKYENYPVLKVIDILGYDYAMYYDGSNQKSLQIYSNDVAKLLVEKFSTIERDTSATKFTGYDVYAKLVCQIEGYGYDVLVLSKFGDEEFGDEKYILELNGKCMKTDESLLRFVLSLISYHKSTKFPSVIEEDVAKALWNKSTQKQQVNN